MVITTRSDLSDGDIVGGEDVAVCWLDGVYVLRLLDDAVDGSALGTFDGVYVGWLLWDVVKGWVVSKFDGESVGLFVGSFDVAIASLDGESSVVIDLIMYYLQWSWHPVL